MKLLLDTHSFLWFIAGDSHLSERARILMEDDSNQLLLSVASLWEIAIKISLGKLTTTQPFEVLIPQQLKLNSIDLLNIEVDHLVSVIALPFYHRDPFDRLLIAQAAVEQIPIIGTDVAFDAYPITRLW